MIKFLKKIFSYLLDNSDSDKEELDQDILNILYLGQIIDSER